MCDGLIEAVKYIWVSILYMKFTSFASAGQLASKEYKIIDVGVPDEMLAVNTNACSH